MAGGLVIFCTLALDAQREVQHRRSDCGREAAEERRERIFAPNHRVEEDSKQEEGGPKAKEEAKAGNFAKARSILRLEVQFGALDAELHGRGIRG